MGQSFQHLHQQANKPRFPFAIGEAQLPLKYSHLVFLVLNNLQTLCSKGLYAPAQMQGRALKKCQLYTVCHSKAELAKYTQCNVCRCQFAGAEHQPEEDVANGPVDALLNTGPAMTYCVMYN